MQQHEEWVLRAADFDATSFEKASRVARRVEQLSSSLKGHQRKNNVENAHTGRFSSSVKPAVKPGPNELSSARLHGVVDASVRSSTNITVAADMLP